jgi:hypothetical protein
VQYDDLGEQRILDVVMGAAAAVGVWLASRFYQ